jgi:hypothetical protein
LSHASVTTKPEDEDNLGPDIESVKPIATLKPGQPHTESLIGPENNNTMLLYVRNLGNHMAYPRWN